MSDHQRAARGAVARRGELGLTQEELAVRAGVDIKTIGNFERRGRWPIARTRARIERALGWMPGELDRIANETAEPKTLAARDGWERSVLTNPDLPDDEKREIIETSRRVRAELYPGAGAAEAPGEEQAPGAAAQ